MHMIQKIYVASILQVDTEINRERNAEWGKRTWELLEVFLQLL